MGWFNTTEQELLLEQARIRSDLENNSAELQRWSSELKKGNGDPIAVRKKIHDLETERLGLLDSDRRLAQQVADKTKAA